MRLWQFNRSGSFESSSFNINEDGFKFTRVMLGYFLMNDEQLGLDPTIPPPATRESALSRNSMTLPKASSDSRPKHSLF